MSTLEGLLPLLKSLISKLKRRLLNLLISADSLLLNVCTLGGAWPGETISSSAYRAEKYGMSFGKARPLIDWLFKWLEHDHCKSSYEFAVQRKNLPEDMRF